MMTKEEVRVTVYGLEDVKFVYSLLKDLNEVCDPIYLSNDHDTHVCMNNRPSEWQCWTSFDAGTKRTNKLQTVTIDELIKIIKNENI